MRKIILALIIMFVFVGNAYATEYNAGTKSVTNSSGTIHVPLTVTYIATPTTLNNINLHKPANYTYSGNFTAISNSGLVNGGPMSSPSVNRLCGHGFSGLTPNTAYVVTVTVHSVGHNSVSNSASPGPAQTWLVYTPPFIPSGINFLNISTDVVSLQWVFPGSNPSDTSYTLQRSNDGGLSWVNVATQTSHSFADVGLIHNTTYLYRVRVNAKNGFHYFSDVYPVTTLRDKLQDSLDAALQARDAALNANHHAWWSMSQTWYTGAFGGNTDSVANIAGYIRSPQHFYGTSQKCRLLNSRNSICKTLISKNKPPLS